MNSDAQQRESILKDLEIQWRDHFHMRDQTWKTLTNSTLLFLGVVGLEIKGVNNFVMVPAYIVLIVIAIAGWAVAYHHRVRQRQKFDMIRKYEELLGIYEFKRPVLDNPALRRGKIRSWLDRVFTAFFIEIMQAGIGIVALFLIIRRLTA